MITSDNAILASYMLWLIGRLDFDLDFRTLRGVIGRWFFMAHTTGRYSSSPESQIEADLTRVSAIERGDGDAFCAEIDRIVRANFTGDYWDISLPNRLDGSGARTPLLYAYWAGLNLLDADLLFSNMRVRDLLDPQVTPHRSIERHHLFPKAYLASQGITEYRQVNAIANMAFVDWPENAQIGADAPSDYWPALAAQISPERLKQQTYWHPLTERLGTTRLSDVHRETTPADRPCRSRRLRTAVAGQICRCCEHLTRRHPRRRRISKSRIQIDGPLERACESTRQEDGAHHRQNRLRFPQR